MQNSICIYIPIWLDLLCSSNKKPMERYIHLHSNMVRFIICKMGPKQYQVLWIYIPIWLDLLYIRWKKLSITKRNLHSNMVRFIICASSKLPVSDDKFTFQYG